jgi:nucleotide-binding universal stress UspA family protein
VSARLLAIVRPGQETAALDGLPALVATARIEHAHLRLACFRPLPPARVDRYDRVIADVDREMDRIARSLVERFRTAARAFADVTVECVVRFGRPAREIRVETDVFAPSALTT